MATTWIAELARVDQGFRNRLREVIGDLLRVSSRDRPIVVLLESAHAIDSMGLRFFGQLLNDITDVKVMVILVGHDTLPRSIEEVEHRFASRPPRRPQPTRTLCSSLDGACNARPLGERGAFPF